MYIVKVEFKKMGKVVYADKNGGGTTKREEAMLFPVENQAKQVANEIRTIVRNDVIVEKV